MDSLSASIDGHGLCFIKGIEQTNVYIGEIQAHGRRLASLHPLTNEDAYSVPGDWTRDSKAVLLLSNRNGRFQIYKQDIDKDTPELITSSLGNYTYIRTSPDGQWVLYIAVDDVPGRPKKRLMRVPPEGGNAQEILSGEYLNGIDCSTRPGGACVLTEIRGNACTFSLIDPIKGRGPKVLEATNVTHAALSPDGQHEAFVLPGTPRNRIRIVDLHGATEQEVTVSSAKNLDSLEWSADGTGFFSSDAQSTGARLLYIERTGASYALWTQSIGGVWGESIIRWSIPCHVQERDERQRVDG
jgi:Tol biopolymer transport system component